MRRPISMLLLIATTVACGEPAGDAPTRVASSRAAPTTTPRAAPPAATRPSIPQAKQVFAQVIKAIDEHYVDAVDDDLLWTGAIEGLLSRLVQLRGKQINTLLEPEQLRQMRAGIAGQFAGVGMVFDIVGETVTVEEVLPGGPAAEAGIRPGDRLLAVDGRKLSGLDKMQIAGLIRGKAGTTVKLFLQRETEEWVEPVVRGRIVLPAVSGQLLGDGQAYLRLGGLKKNTVERLDALIDELLKKGARGLILDLRGCPGGLFDAAIAVADRFLPPAQTVVSIRRRGGEREVKRTREQNPADRLPLVVLVDEQTSSGAEIIAAALQHEGRAQIVGAPTLGKGTVENILELPDGWALKLTVARFFAPDGRPMQGQGVTPDFPIAGDPASQRRRYFTVTADPENDPPLAAALRLLRLSASAPASPR